jgi:Ecdysteroid kinase-like family
MTEPPAAAQPEHLSEALRRCGVLRDGRVHDVAVENARATILSRIMRLRLAYDGDAGDAPRSVFFKTGLPERLDGSWSPGRQEVAFYTQVAAAMSAPLVPRCFDAHWDADTKGWHLILEDLTDSHMIATAWPVPPTFAQCESIIRARARFHAHWWDDPRLGAAIGTWLPADNSQLERFAQEFARFANRMGEGLPSERRDLYQRLIEAGARLNRRYHSHRNLTIVQGDAHVWNIFLPRADDSEDVRLFDWDSWRVDVATDDLAYMMAMHWYPDRRRGAERPLLDAYHAELLAHGVTGYDRHALDDDYRLSVLWQITTPVWQANYNIPPVIWWNNLERIFLAVEDLGCRELLEESP